MGSRIEFRSVSKTHGRHRALAEVSFTLRAGEHTALIGPSGCGKSTALRLLAGLDAPSAGQVLLDDTVVSQPGKILRPPHLRGLAMVFQDLALWPNLTVYDNVLFGLAGAQLANRAARTRALEALSLCGIEALAERRPGQTSGGQQQRIALARALAVQPAFLLLDEPFSGLDMVIKTKLLQEIAALAAQRHITVLLVAHDPGEITMLCHSAIVLGKGGTVEEAGVLTSLLGAPRSEILKTFGEYLRRLTFSLRA
jgi:ABC-type Fe3+/spermidine/putrescine transport system ATPase subunit